MTVWLELPLADVCEIVVGRTPSRGNREYWDGEQPWATIADMAQGRVLSSTKEAITNLALNECGCKVIPTGTLLYSFKLSIGKVSFTGVPLVTNEAIAALPIKRSDVDAGYLFWALKSLDAATGADVAAKGKTLNKAKLECLRIPVPPLNQQKRIAGILDAAEALSEKRRAATEVTHSLIQATFLEFFGDPVLNSKGWPIRKLADVGALDRGVSKHRPRNAPELLGGPHPLVQTGDVANSDGYIRTHSSAYSDAGLRQSRLWPAGTLCITIAANIGKVAILTFDACFPDSVVGFSAESPAMVEYVRVWFSFLQKSLEDGAPESAQKNINLAILRGLDIPVPPRQLQEEFLRRVASIESIKAQQRASNASLRSLFGGLQYRAFRGEL